MAIIGETAVNVTPCSRGSFTPTFQNPTDWMIEAMPQVKRSALMRWMSSWVDSPMALARRMGSTSSTGWREARLDWGVAVAVLMTGLSVWSWVGRLPEEG